MIHIKNEVAEVLARYSLSPRERGSKKITL
jgi:hypothetical protein